MIFKVNCMIFIFYYTNLEFWTNLDVRVLTLQIHSRRRIGDKYHRFKIITINIHQFWFSNEIVTSSVRIDCYPTKIRKQIILDPKSYLYRNYKIKIITPYITQEKSGKPSDPVPPLVAVIIEIRNTVRFGVYLKP